MPQSSRPPRPASPSPAPLAVTDLLQRIVEHARTHGDPTALLAVHVALEDAELLDAARNLFGSWELALACALTELARATAPAAASAPSLAARSGPRSLARPPLVAVTRGGWLVRFDGQALLASETPTAPAPIAGWSRRVGPLRALFDAGRAGAMLALARDGRASEVDLEALPGLREAGRKSPARGGWLTLLERDPVERPPLLVHATRQGRVKVSLVTTLLRALEEGEGGGGVLAFGLEPGDEPIDAWLAERSDALVVATATGELGVVELETVVPDALEATGRVVADLGAPLLGGVVGGRGVEVAMVLRTGEARRMRLDSLRALRGARAATLSIDGNLAALVTCHASTDLVVLTSRGRALRLPALALPIEPAPWGRIVELGAGEGVEGLCRLQPLAEAVAPPNPFEI